MRLQSASRLAGRGFHRRHHRGARLQGQIDDHLRELAEFRIDPYFAAVLAYDVV